MSQAPALPAQTPGMFLGGGGTGTELTGECAEALTDCGLSAADVAPFEELIETVRAAHDRCADYDDARWLEERERSFAPRAIEAQRTLGREKRLPRAPTTRERHLALCVAATIVPSSFFQSRPGDARTNVRPGAGYDLRRAPAAPQLRGLCLRTAVHHAFTTLRPELRQADGSARRVGSAIDENELERYREERVRQILLDALDEDAPRLRSTALTSSTRPRQAESDRRAIEQVLPEPPQLASTVAPEAHGAGRSSEQNEDPSATGVQRRAQGCVAGTADAQERAMQLRVRDDYGDAYAQTQRETQDRELETRRERTQRAIAWEQADLDLAEARESGRPLGLGRALNKERRTAVALARASSDQHAASSAVGSLPALRRQAIEMASMSNQPGRLSGQMPSVLSPANLICDETPAFRRG